MLSWKDSNPHKQNQNLRCYHYTTRQWFFNAANIEIFFLVNPIKPMFLKNYFQTENRNAMLANYIMESS